MIIHCVKTNLREIRYTGYIQGNRIEAALLHMIPQGMITWFLDYCIIGSVAQGLWGMQQVQLWRQGEFKVLVCIYLTFPINRLYLICSNWHKDSKLLFFFRTYAYISFMSGVFFNVTKVITTNTQFTMNHWSEFDTSTLFTFTHCVITGRTCSQQHQKWTAVHWP